MASDSNPHVVQDTDMSMWDDPSFTSLYDNFGASAESPFDGSRLFDMNAAGAADSPNFAIKSTYEEESGRSSHQNQPFQSRSLVSSRSAESSSQDSASETSGRKRQNTSATSESPPAMHSVHVKREYDGMQPMSNHALHLNHNQNYNNHGNGNGMNMDAGIGSNANSTNMGNGTNGSNRASLQSFGRSMHALSLEPEFARQNQSNAMNSTFDFESAASSPGGNMDMADVAYTQQIQAQMKRPPTMANRAHHDPPMGTVEPQQFFFGSSTASPASVKASHGPDASPGAMFSNPTPSSDGADLFTNNQMWNAAAAASSSQNPAWNNDYSNAFASPGGGLGMTPSPVMNSQSKINLPSQSVEGGRIPLHIAPIPQKSRVETQINIRLTMDWVPGNIKMLHLPTHTIAKAKLLAKDTKPSDDTLELHTMLVCTSAMNQPALRQKALERAAQQNNAEIQARGQSALKKEEEEESEDDKPANGGEVRICTNCINRERKRAARKKLKKEEEQAHWEKYETERVIVFNTNEYKPWQEWQQSPAPKDNSLGGANDMFKPSDSAMQVVAPMRIACYCRHQNEKDGFQVIFTIKDYLGKVVAQEMSDSILITDDHKTHPLATVAGQVWYDGQFPPPAPYASHSMVDMHSHAQALQQSKSTSNLPSYNLMSGQPFHTPNNMHTVNGMQSQTTSGTMTPRNLSRPASPNNTGQCGPSKKRKSSSAHRRIPSTLTMTRVDTNQSLPSASMSNAPFSPTNTGFPTNGESPYVTMPHSASRAQFHTGPSTPIDQNPSFPFGSLNRTNSMDSTAYAFYSAPSSAHQSRAPSPVLVGPNLAAFQRQQAHGGVNALPTRPNPFSMSTQSLSTAASEPERPPPIINKINPSEGPASGGTEVSVYGSGFTPSMTVMFGDQEAVATTYWGEKALVALLPASAQSGSVPVTIAPSQTRQFSSPPSGQAPMFKYANKPPDVQTMELALRFYSQKETGREDQWQVLAQSAANAWISQGPMPTGHQAYPAPQASQFADQTNDLRFAQ